MAKVEELLSFKCFTEANREKYLAALRTGHSLTGAAQAAHISHVTAWAYRRKYPEFEAEVQKAREEGTNNTVELIEDALIESAIGGNLTAIQVYLYNRAPHKWRDKRSIEIKGLEDVFGLLPPGLANRLREELARLVPNGSKQVGLRSNGEVLPVQE